jgi:hypothetical protein
VRVDRGVELGVDLGVVRSGRCGCDPSELAFIRLARASQLPAASSGLLGDACKARSEAPLATEVGKVAAKLSLQLSLQ